MSLCCNRNEYKSMQFRFGCENTRSLIGHLLSFWIEGIAKLYGQTTIQPTPFKWMLSFGGHCITVFFFADRKYGYFDLTKIHFKNIWIDGKKKRTKLNSTKESTAAIRRKCVFGKRVQMYFRVCFLSIIFKNDLTYPDSGVPDDRVKFTTQIHLASSIFWQLKCSKQFVCSKKSRGDWTNQLSIRIVTRDSVFQWCSWFRSIPCPCTFHAGQIEFIIWK